ncbi:unnamed protein product [Callosobruchus maculatus]|uniref:Lipocalin/cytosolic fatty-acid binding domain-containing protein n=1 Tax=Callosobruchus maculatus TaxID=64391 RepID=A0A653D912_CALMS|nr:unnamed protein product [Callosobruchus maculatus]
MTIQLVLVLAMAAIAASQHCQYTPPSIPIDLEKFSGIWYSQKRFGDSYIITPDCFRINLSANKHDEGFSLIFDHKNRKDQVESTPLQFEPAGSNYYKLTLSGTTYLVAFLAVEYDSYAVYYDCSSTEGFSYVLTRSKERNDTLIDVAVREAKQVSPFLPPPATELNCEIF